MQKETAQLQRARRLSSAEHRQVPPSITFFSCPTSSLERFQMNQPSSSSSTTCPVPSEFLSPEYLTPAPRV